MNWLGLGNSFQLFAAYFLLAVIVTVITVRRSKPGWRKWAAGIGTFFIFWGLTLVDDFMGMREHKALCEKEGGVKIYKQARLPREFYDAEGRPKFIEENGQIYANAISRHIKLEWKIQDAHSLRFLKIDRTTYKIIDVRSGELLAEDVGFNRWPSPFVPSLLHGGAVSCKGSARATYESDMKLHRRVFPSLAIDKGAS